MTNDKAAGRLSKVGKKGDKNNSQFAVRNSQLKTEASMPLVKTRKLKVTVLQLRIANYELRIAWCHCSPRRLR